jgi:hypothetical protein
MVRLIEQHSRLTPRALFVTPVRPLAFHRELEGGILYITKKLYRIPTSTLNSLLKTLYHHLKFS